MFVHTSLVSVLLIHPANPSGADQAVFAHTLMALAPSWEGLVYNPRWCVVDMDGA